MTVTLPLSLTRILHRCDLPGDKVDTAIMIGCDWGRVRARVRIRFRVRIRVRVSDHHAQVQTGLGFGQGRMGHAAHTYAICYQRSVVHTAALEISRSALKDPPIHESKGCVGARKRTCNLPATLYPVLRIPYPILRNPYPVPCTCTLYPVPSSPNPRALA